MIVAEARGERRRLAAPREDGGLLVDPGWQELPRYLAANVTLRRRSSVDLQGIDLHWLAQTARRQLVADAVAYTRQYRDVPQLADPTAPLILAGHQPKLFHPGVWCKNFALGQLARQQQAIAINLLVDSDEVRSTASRVPGGSLQQPVVAVVPFDQPVARGIAFEACAIGDRALLRSFAERAATAIAPLISDPLVSQFWPLVIARADATGNLGLALAQARHQWEGRWGLDTLELPQSHCCSGEAFWQFAIHLLAHLPRLWDIYNSSLAEYRRTQKIRSAAHPVPDLAVEHDWLEAPFWVWTADDPRRRPLFVQFSGDRLLLSDRVGGHWTLEASEDSTAERAAAQLADYQRSGLRLRTRALLTTMYARLMLSDLFIHGIGGSKYDELTDLLIERFFGLKPPAYATLSATVRLPVARPDIEADALGQLDHQIRALAHHPEAYLAARSDRRHADGSEPWTLIERKRRWLAGAVAPQSAPIRHRELAEINERLWPYVADEAQRLEEQRVRVRQELRNAAILASREYDFCLYPGEYLQRFLCEEMPRKLACD
jgi:hypothetical protein